MTEAALVSVGCNLPNGLILELKSNGGEIQRHTLQGANAARIFGGYGITPNIPADFMTMWFKKNARLPAVVNGSIFLHNDAASAVVMAKERKEIDTGLAPIDPVKRGMLRNEAGVDDPKALKQYREQQGVNPDRNRQQVE